MTARLTLSGMQQRKLAHSCEVGSYVAPLFFLEVPVGAFRIFPLCSAAKNPTGERVRRGSQTWLATVTRPLCPLHVRYTLVTVGRSPGGAGRGGFCIRVGRTFPLHRLTPSPTALGYANPCEPSDPWGEGQPEPPLGRSEG